MEKITNLRQFIENRLAWDIAPNEAAGMPNPGDFENHRDLIPPVFILSPARSGSTLLRVMLAGSPDLFAPPELELLSFTNLQRRKTGFSLRLEYMLEGLVRAVMSLKECDAEQARKWIEQCEEQEMSTPDFYALLQQWCGARRLVDKSVHYAMSPTILRRAEDYFEDALYIHLSRHPFGTMHSIESLRMHEALYGNIAGYSPRELAEGTWQICHENILSFLSDVPPQRQRHLRFEDLVAQPEATLRQLCDFLAVPFHPAMLNPYEEKQKRMTDEAAGSVMLGDPRFHQRKAIDPAAADAWKNEMEAVELGEQSQALATRLGYRDVGHTCPGSTAQQASLPTEAELLQMQAWNDTQADYSPEANKTIAQLFEEQVEKTPDHIALIFEDKELTYKELNERANQVAHRLRADFAIQPDDIIALQLERSEWMIVAILGVLKSGAAYLPVAPDAPKSRVEFMLRDSRAKALLTSHRESEGVTSSYPLTCIPSESEGVTSSYPLTCIPSESEGVTSSYPLTCIPVLAVENLQAGRTDNPAVINRSHDLAYIIYTSGSTGQPKGVMIEHRGAVNMALCQIQQFDLCPADRVLHFAAYTFDASVSELCMALLSGATLVLASQADIHAPGKLMQLVENQHVSVATLPPAYLTSLDKSKLQNLRLLITAGEKPVLEQVQSLHRHLRYVNAYGPTECSVCVSTFEVPENWGKPFVPIGKPIFNTQIHILNAERQLVPIGTAGELCVSGVGLARGYLNNPELTAEKFIAHPLRPGERLYRTGDLARWLPDGNLEFLGRLDHQLKIRGYRIEAGEVEQTLLKHPDVQACVVVGIEVGTELELAAYIQPKPALFSPLPAEAGNDQFSFWPSVAEFYVYDDLLYYAMTHDEKRNKSYKAAIDQSVKDKVVVEIGTGKDAILARLCAEAGAKKVYAIELEEDTFRQARNKVQELGLSDKIILLHGDACQVDLPEKADVSVSEIVGTIGGSEGAARIMNESRHLLKEDAVVIPCRSETVFAAVSLPQELLDRPGFQATPFHYVQKIFEQVGYPFDLRICVKGLSEANLLSNRQAFEDLDYTQPVQLEGSHEFCFTIHKKGRMHGLLVWLNLHTAPGEVIDTLPEEYSWLPVFLPVFYPGLEVEPGDRIVGSVQRTLCRNGLNPDFLITGCLESKNGNMEHFQYKSSHFDPAFRHNAFYDRLFQPTLQTGSPASWRAFLKEQLPDYMLPSHFVELENLPLTSSGKVNRKALPAPPDLVRGYPDDASALASETTFAAPRNAIERQLADIWRLVLGRENVPLTIGIHDNFFNLGGHSLRAIRLLSLIKQQLAVELNLTEVFARPTIADLAQKVAELAHLHPIVLQSIPKIEQQESYPLSNAQRRLWVLAQMDDGALAAYNMPAALRLRGELDKAALEQAFRLLFERHEILRTRFVNVEGEGRQVIDPPLLPGENLEYSVGATLAVAQVLPGENLEYSVGATLAVAQVLPGENLEYSVGATLAVAQVAQARLPNQTRATARVAPTIIPKLFPEVSAGFDLSCRDCRQNSEEEIAALARAHASRVFDLQNERLLQVELLQTGPDRGSGEHLLLFNMHHIISDGWSMNLLLEELSKLYEACAGAFIPHPSFLIPALPIQYKDFAAWQNALLEEEATIGELRSYWQRQLAELPTLDLPVDFPRPAFKTYRGASVQKQFSAELSQKLQALSQANGATLFMSLTALLNTLLYKYTGQSDIVIGTPSAGRNHPDLHDQVGFYVNTLALRNQVEGGESFAQLLQQVKTTALAAFEHELYPFDRLVEDLNLPRDTSRSAVFDVMLALQNNEQAALKLGDLDIQMEPADAHISKFDLTFAFTETPQGLALDINFNTDLFRPDRIGRMAQHLETLIISVLNSPAQQIDRLEILPEAERHLLLHDFSAGSPPEADNQTETDYLDSHRDQTISQLFEQQAEKTPGNVAVIFEDKQLTYKELNERANRLAHHLRQEFHIQPDDVIALQLERSEWMLIAILGVLKSGAAYLPIAPDAPRSRVEFMLRDSRAKALLTSHRESEGVTSSYPLTWTSHRESEGVTSSYPLTWIPILAVENLQAGKLDNPAVINRSQDLAYIIYTSGSTGQPKGVMIEHRGLVNMVCHQRQQFEISPLDKVLQFADYTFDTSISEIWVSLTAGAALVMATKETLLSPEQFAELLQREQVSVADLPPAFLATLDEGALGTVRLLITGGEAAHPATVRRHGSARQYINGYGPTETTVTACTFKVPSPGDSFGDIVPIGRPIANVQAVILGKNLELLPLGISGELCIGGAGLARGYLNNPELTAEKFIEHPFKEGERLYRTGDLARWLPDGNIEFLGRLDQQLKIRGYRIEAGEIEQSLLAHPAVQSCVVVGLDFESGNPDSHRELVAYLVASQSISDRVADSAVSTFPTSVGTNSTVQLNVATLRSFLSESLPEYMLPAYFVEMPSLPLTSSGKVNRKALPAPDSPDLGRGDDASTFATGTTYLAPRNAAEQQLADIWQQILGRQNIGIHDHFFHLGGHSLKAIQLAARISQAFDIRFPVAAIFLHPRLADLAAHLRQFSPHALPAGMQLSVGDRPFLFAFPPSLGSGIFYQGWVHLLENKPVYAFDFLPEEDRMEKYYREIKTQQPSGSYHLMGYSVGGNLAYEIARYLEFKGETVSELILLDSAVHIDKYGQTDEELQTAAQDLVDYVASLHLAESQPLQDELTRRQVMQRSLAYHRYFNELVTEGKIAANIRLLHLGDVPEAQQKWANFTFGKFTTHQGEGEHLGMFLPSHMEANAALLDGILQQIFQQKEMPASHPETCRCNGAKNGFHFLPGASPAEESDLVMALGLQVTGHFERGGSPLDFERGAYQTLFPQKVNVVES